MKNSNYLSELFSIVEGALRLDGEKVKNYSLLLAENLKNGGQESASKRLLKLVEQNSRQLRPAFVESTNIPVDSESRFPLLSLEYLEDKVSNFVFPENQQQAFDEFLSVIKSKAELENNGIPVSSTLLLYGPPGCGKTHLARLISKELNLPLYSARLDGLVSSYLGSTAKNIRAILEFAAKKPCVLFLDELDAIAKLRDDVHELGELKRVVNSLLQSLDILAKDTIIIAATNHEQILDPAVWRRFHYQIFIGPPNFEQRKKIWTLYCRGIEFTDNQMNVLADLSEGFSIASIEAASNRLRQKSFLNSTEPSIKDALLLLTSYPTISKPAIEGLQDFLTKEPTEIINLLNQRNSSIYTFPIIGEIVGRSKSTIYRFLKSTPEEIDE
jgi:SpoVK/Ycf46/Vps4 family AAA+-type ATPase